MSWSFKVQGSTKVAAASRAVSALLTCTAEQRGHDADAPTICDAIQGAVAALADPDALPLPAGMVPGYYEVEGFGHASGGGAYPCHEVQFSVKARYWPPSPKLGEQA